MTVAHANRQFQTNGKAELSISTESNSITFYLNVHFPSAVSFSLLRASRYPMKSAAHAIRQTTLAESTVP